jgi:DNA-binding MarR family transcriptional regulator
LVGSAQEEGAVDLDRESTLTGEKPSKPDQAAPERLVSTLHDASRALQRLLIAQTRASGLGMLEFLVLSRAAEGGVTPGEVGRSLGLSTSTMTGLVDRLAGDGLVRRHQHPADGRLLLVRATSKGRKLRERSVGPILESLSREVASLDAAEEAVTTRFLDRVAELLNAQAEELQKAAQRSRRRAGTPRRIRSVRD